MISTDVSYMFMRELQVSCTRGTGYMYYVLYVSKLLGRVLHLGGIRAGMWSKWEIGA